MPFINFSKDEIQCKVVYYGPGFCGKTTNLQYIFVQTIERKKNIESLINLAKNLAEKGISVRSIPLVLQYNKRDLDGTDSEILPIEVLEKDLNTRLKVPSFPASAVKGTGVFETLREIR